MNKHIVAVILLLISTNACAAPLSDPFPKADVQVAGVTIQVQLAATPALRARGLMFQKSADPGMLLLYPEPHMISLWMRNTDLHLDVAFIDADWRIIAIKPLLPLDETPVATPTAALAALEMPRGWFAERNIQVGEQLKLIR